VVIQGCNNYYGLPFTSEKQQRLPQKSPPPLKKSPRALQSNTAGFEKKAAGFETGHGDV